MSWIDRLEKLGRLLLWLAIASVFVIAPLGYAKHDRAEGDLRAALQRAETKLAEATKPGPVERLLLTSMPNYVYGLNQATGVGHVTFTNPSRRAGVLCAYARLKNPATSKGISSIPACQQVAAYASLLDVKLLFAGGDVEAICGRTKCEMELLDMPIGEGEQIAEK